MGFLFRLVELARYVAGAERLGTEEASSSPGRPSGFWRWLSEPGTQAAGQVGDEPGAPSFLAWLLAPERLGDARGPGPGSSGRGFAAWLITPEGMARDGIGRQDHGPGFLIWLLGREGLPSRPPTVDRKECADE